MEEGAVVSGMEEEEEEEEVGSCCRLTEVEEDLEWDWD